MGSNLLNKGTINRKNTATPKESYSGGVESPPEKFTSVRVSQTMKNRLNAMVAMGLDETVDKLIVKLTDVYISEKFSDEEKKKFEFMFDIYKNK